jgi:polysaccharide pyruvyl transferase WcaK-like protein
MARSPLGWRSAARLPATFRPDVVMAPPAEVARAFVDLADRDEEIARVVGQVETARVVIVNGEGDLILTKPPRRKLVFLLAVMELAHHVGTPCVYVNAMVSDPPDHDRSPDVTDWARAALERCRLVALRDEWSVGLARDLRFHADVRWVPDALFTWHGVTPLELKDDALTRQGWPREGGPALDLDDPYVCVSGSSAYSPTGLAPPVDAYCQLVDQLQREGVRVVLVEGAEADEFLRVVADRCDAPLVPWATNIHVSATILGRSQVFVSGRHHPTILAALGGSYPVMIGSNSHKNVSLQQVLAIDEPVEVDSRLGSSAVTTVHEATIAALGEHDEGRRSALRARCGELADLARGLPDAISGALGAGHAS